MKLSWVHIELLLSFGRKLAAGSAYIGTSAVAHRRRDGPFAKIELKSADAFLRGSFIGTTREGVHRNQVDLRFKTVDKADKFFCILDRVVKGVYHDVLKRDAVPVGGWILQESFFQLL